MTTIQCYCTLDELLLDAENASGLADDVLTRFILPASQYLSQEIGPFLPVTETLRFTGDGNETLRALRTANDGKQGLFVPPLLRLTGDIDNDGVSVSRDTAVLRASQQSSRPAWPYGPYYRIDETDSVWSRTLNGVVVPGVWGLYERADSLGATLAATQIVSAETLTVADGSKISIGMVLQVGDEMQFVSARGTATSATTLGAAMDASQEEITLANGALVKKGEVLQVDFEKIKVLDLAGNKAYVARGWERSKRVSHDNGAAVSVYRSYTVKRAQNGTTAAEHASGVAISRYLVPEDVNYLTRQIATLMMQKSRTGYAGRAGNPESGESYFLYEFPREAIERVKKNYYVPAVR